MVPSGTSAPTLAPLCSVCQMKVCFELQIQAANSLPLSEVTKWLSLKVCLAHMLHTFGQLVQTLFLKVLGPTQ